MRMNRKNLVQFFFNHNKYFKKYILFFQIFASSNGHAFLFTFSVR